MTDIKFLKCGCRKVWACKKDGRLLECSGCYRRLTCYMEYDYKLTAEDFVASTCPECKKGKEDEED